MNLGFLSTPNRWSYFMVSLLLILVSGYIVWHIIDRPGSKNVMLSTAEQTDIQNILDGAQSPGTSAPTSLADSTVGQAPSGANAVSGVTESFDTKRERVYEYITRTHTMLDTAANSQLRATLALMPNERSLQSYLTTHPVRVYSPYHLNGRSLLWELICWALFGVFCNLFYRVSEAYKGADIKKAPAETTDTQAQPATDSDHLELVSQNATNTTAQNQTTPERLRRRLLGGFDPAEVPSHIAKLLYTPFLVVILYLSLVSFDSSTDLQWVQYGEGVIVFAFILGFFAGRMVDFLERIKDLILPIGRWGNEPPASDPATSGSVPAAPSEQETLMETASFDSLSRSPAMMSAFKARTFLPSAGFAELKIKYRLELDKPTRRLTYFDIGSRDFLPVVVQQLDAAKTTYSNQSLSTTLDTLSNGLAGTPDFFKVFLNFRILRGNFEPDPAIDCFLFLSYVDPATQKPVAFPPKTPNPRNATFVFRMGSGGIIHIHEDVIWSTPIPQPTANGNAPAPAPMS